MATSSRDPVSEIQTAWAALSKDDCFQALKNHVADVMSAYDPSHDFGHVLRVLRLSHQILLSEASSTFGDPQTVYYAALLHDLFDRKYASASSSGNIASLLMAHGREEQWSTKLETIVENISYKYETTNQDRAKAALTSYPELAVVQDADRLDAIGAIGIGRVFTYGGAKAPQRGMQGSVEHFVVKLEKLESMMKVSCGKNRAWPVTDMFQTETGKRMAKERTSRLTMFRSWWEEEMAVSSLKVPQQ